MKLIKIASIVAATIALATAGQAQTVQVPAPSTAPGTHSMLTRAEVMADYHLYRLAGLADLDNRGQGSPDTESDEYMAAYARYESLRNSPAYPKLVEQLMHHPYAKVTKLPDDSVARRAP